MATSRSPGSVSVTSTPPMSSRPAVGRSSPAARRRSVVLPQPDGPTRTTASPSRRSIDTLLTATVPSAKVLPILSNEREAIRTFRLFRRSKRDRLSRGGRLFDRGERAGVGEPVARVGQERSVVGDRVDETRNRFEDEAADP